MAFSRWKSECIAPARARRRLQVNYDFYENLTALKFDRIIEDLDAGRHPAPEPVISEHSTSVIRPKRR